MRAGKRLADALDAEWIVVYVETPALLRLSEAERNRRISVLRLAESLGAESVTLDGPSAAATLAEYAHVRNATRVIVGAPKRRGWRAWLRPSTATELVRRARGFDVLLIGATRTAATLPDAPPGAPPGSSAVRWDRYAWAAALAALCTLLAFAMYPHFELSNLVMIYLLGVTVAGLRLGRGPSALTALLNVAAFDFFFVPPRYSFAVSDVQYLVTFGAMLTIALVIATLTASVRQQTRVAGARERRTALLYAMSRELAATRGIAQHGARRRAARGGSVPMPGGGAAAGGGRQAALPRRSAAGELLPRRRSRRCASGLPITAAAQVSAPILCRRRAGCTCRWAMSSAPWGCWQCCRAIRAACCCRSRVTCSVPLPDRSRSPWSARAWRRLRRPPASPPSARRCVTRCSPPSRTTCARRSP